MCQGLEYSFQLKRNNNGKSLIFFQEDVCYVNEEDYNMVLSTHTSTNFISNVFIIRPDEKVHGYNISPVPDQYLI